MVKAVGIFKNSGITTHSYIRQDGSDRTVYRFVLRTFKSQQSIEPRREIGIPTGQTLDPDHDSTTLAKAFRMGTIFSRLSLSAA